MEKTIFFNSLSKQYINLQNKIRQNYKILDTLKLVVTVVILFMTIGVYGYFVNVSSTKGYFLRHEMKNFEEAKFNNSIVQVEVLKLERDIWDGINTNTVIKAKKISIDEKVVYVNYKTEEKLALNRK